jgi:Serine carboxypeptidase
MKAGYHEKFTGTKHGIDFVTFNGAGHMVPQYKPVESLALLSRWLADEDLKEEGKQNRWQRARPQIADVEGHAGKGFQVPDERIARRRLPAALHRPT